MWAVVINTISGGGRGAVVGREVVGHLSARKLSYEVITASSQEKLRENLRGFLSRSSDHCNGVIGVGGDGLLHMLLQEVVGKRLPYTVIPAGTGNDYARAVGWDLESISSQLDVVTSQPARPIDLGLVDSEWFGAILSTGFDSIVNERANRLRWPNGPMKYNASIAYELTKFKPLEYLIKIDNQIIESAAMLIAVGNGSSYGGGMRVCPQANMHDGLFDIMILRPVSKLEFLKVFPRVFTGSHIDHPAVEVLRGSKVELSAPAVAYADGERIGGLPVKAECLAGAGLSWTP